VKGVYSKESVPQRRTTAIERKQKHSLHSRPLGTEQAVKMSQGEQNHDKKYGIVNLIKMVEIITEKNLESGASSLFSRSYIPL
jgi:hypothetical protein